MYPDPDLYAATLCNTRKSINQTSPPIERLRLDSNITAWADYKYRSAVPLEVSRPRLRWNTRDLGFESAWLSSAQPRSLRSDMSTPRLFYDYYPCNILPFNMDSIAQVSKPLRVVHAESRHYL